MIYSTSGKVRVYNPRTKQYSGWLSEDEGRRLENRWLYQVTPTGTQLKLVKK